MKANRRGLAGRVLIGLLWATSPAGAAENDMWTFDKDETGALPKGFVAAVGQWIVVAYDNGKVLAQLARDPTPFSTWSSLEETMPGTLTFRSTRGRSPG